MALFQGPAKYQSIGIEKIWNLIFSQAGRAIKAMDGILITPQELITSDISAAPVYVGNGNLLRVRVTATTYLAFGPSTISAPSSTTSNALELFSAGVYLISANDDYVMASSNPARVEILNGRS